MKSILKVFSIFTPKERWHCFFIVFCMLIGAIFEAIGIGAILPLISIMGDSGFLEKHTLIQQYVAIFHVTTHTNLIMYSAGLLILFYIIKNAYMMWLTKLQIHFSLNNQIYYAGKLLDVYIHKPYLYHLDQNSAILIRNISGGTSAVFSVILVSIFTLITEIITAFMIWLMLVFTDPFTALIVAGILGSMMLVLLKVFRKKIADQGKFQSEYSAIYAKWLQQSLGAIKETKVLRKEEYFLRKFQEAYQNFGEANKIFMFLNQLPRLFIETLVTCGLLVLIITKMVLGTEPMAIVPLLGVLALAAFRLMPCANRIVNLSNTIKFQMPMFELLYDDLLEIKHKKMHVGKLSALDIGYPPLSFEKNIVVENVSFHYPQGKETVLKDVSFTILKGSFVGIIGQSGAGKTTFVDLLLGLLALESGKILVDGQDISENIRGWQANLAYVPQMIYLIDGTIRENIALGVDTEKIDDAEINRVLKMAELYEFVQGLTDVLETRVGERGVKLSGGQRQRIGIARALYCNPKVLILDEATSALDNETEKSITDTILKLKGQITIIAIAHRVSTLKNCDFKIKFEDGKAELID